MTRSVISSGDVQQAAGGRLVASPDAVITPLARDLARDLRVEIVTGRRPAAPGAGAGDLTSLVRRTVESLLEGGGDGAAVPTTGTRRPVARQASDRDLVAEPLPAAELAPGTRGAYGEVIGLAGHSGLRVGYLTLCSGSARRAADTDQVLVVVEGELALVSGAVQARARAGEVLFIPASSQVRLETPAWAKAVCIMTGPEETT